MSCSARGFSLFELVLVIALVSVLFLTIALRLLPLRGDAEAAHVAQVVGSLRSGLGLAVAERAIGDEGLDTLAELDGVNPMRFLSQVPPNYIGPQPGPGAPPPGAWAFDPQSGRLLYTVRHPAYLAGAHDAPVTLAWRVVVNGSGGSPHIDLEPEPDQPGWADRRRDRAALQPTDPAILP